MSHAALRTAYPEPSHDLDALSSHICAVLVSPMNRLWWSFFFPGETHWEWVRFPLHMAHSRRRAGILSWRTAFMQCPWLSVICFPRSTSLCLLASRCLGDSLCPLSFWKHKTKYSLIASVILLFKKKSIFILWWQIWKKRKRSSLSVGDSCISEWWFSEDSAVTLR